MSRSDGRLSALSEISNELADLVEGTLPSVVTLRGMNAALQEWSGSGFLVSEDGHIVTNHHVVDGVGSSMTATMHGGGEAGAEIIGSDPITDLAVVRIQAEPIVPLPIRSTTPRVGELCIAIGSPLGIFAESVSLGVVSGLDRSLPAFDGQWTMEHMIQTDAAINHGNSGGPLIDVDGQVIGVNDCGRSDGQNISFAIPGETVVAVSEELIRYGSVVRCALGVVIADATVSADGRQFRGVVVTDIREGTDLQPGDALVSVGDRPVRNRGDLFRSLTRELIGMPTPIEVVRDGSYLTVEVVPSEARAR